MDTLGQNLPSRPMLGAAAALLSVLFLHAAPAAAEGVTKDVEGVEKTVLLPPGPNNPRNSEGDFITLKDGGILFVYTHFTGGASDHAAAHLAARVSKDAGRTWTREDVVVLPNEGKWNVMSVSLLRLADGRIAMFYLQKNSTRDCRPVMRVSTDEAKSWSDATQIIPDSAVDYYVLNNDRVIQIQSGSHKGRLVVPVAQHSFDGKDFPPGKIACYLSDDVGRTWQRSSTTLDRDVDGNRVNFQEPGVVELKDGSLLIFIRTEEGSQYLTRSSDGGKTWTEPRPSEILSPLSPASIERIPSSGDLLLAWNDHRDVPPNLRKKRTPYAIAVSKDDGRTWTAAKVLEDHPDGWYCYTAIHFVDDQVLLGHCAGNQTRGRAGLNTTQITRFPVRWLYEN
jgi:sialidase-1